MCIRDSDGTVVTSDPLYRNEAGNPTYPLGTYTLREVKAPTYYEIKGSATIKGTGTTVDDPGKPLILVIKINPDTGKPGIYDGDKLTSGQVSVTNEVGITYNEEVYEGSLKVVKYGDDNKPLADVKFKPVSYTHLMAIWIRKKQTQAALNPVDCRKF